MIIITVVIILFRLVTAASWNNNNIELLEQSYIEINDFAKNECIILGDFNTDIKKTGNPLIKALNSFEKMFSLKQLIMEPTRVCARSQSILDLILVSDQKKVNQSDVIHVGLSDHFLTFCTRKVTKQLFNKHNTIHIRSTKHYNREDFINLLSNLNWSDVMNNRDSCDAWSKFKDKFISILDTVAPF